MSPAEFVRSMPDATPSDILAEAEKMGLPMTRNQIHKTRWNEKQKGKKHSRKAELPPGGLEARIFEFCKGHLEKHGKGPRMPLIIAATKASAGGISSTLRILKQKGFLNWEPGNYDSMTLGKPKRAVANTTIAYAQPKPNGKAITLDDVLGMELTLTTKYQTEMAGLALIKKLFGP